MPDYTMIETGSDLEAVRLACRDVSVIAVDTEFARFNTYYPIVALIQINTGEACFLIDPLGIDDMSVLNEILTRDSLLKVFHACSEDMEVFQHAMGVIPAPVYDTQIAGAVLGIGFSVGYQAMVEHYLNIVLPKDQTRSDWLARPLSEGQKDYAALDVIHLLEVYQKQAEDLRGTDKETWVDAESLMLGQNIPTTIEPAECYKKLKGLWQLDRRQLNALRSLCAWRETTARNEDKPRNRIADQKALMMIARGEATGRQALQHVARMTPRQVRKYGDEIMFLLSEANQLPEEDCPEQVVRDDVPTSNNKIKKLKKVVERRATELQVAPELLVKRRHLEKLIRSEDISGVYHLPAELMGWRKEAIGTDLLAALTE